jgi:DeoR family fructose operon transcriptional repressor
MLIAERQSKLREMLARRGMADLDTLAGELGVSQSTIRRDLDALESEGVCKRTHGGVIWTGDRNGTSRPFAFDQRMNYQLDPKRHIARAARQLVNPGETILIDGGTTTYYFAEELVGMDLQIATNSLPIANLFLNDEKVELILSGGVLYPRSGVLLGPLAETALGTIHSKMFFLSVAGVDDNNLYNQNLLLVESEYRMMQQAQTVVLLADSTKFGQRALARLCELKEVHIVVSDQGLSEAHRDMVRKAGCQLIIAEPPGE